MRACALKKQREDMLTAAMHACVHHGPTWCNHPVNEAVPNTDKFTELRGQLIWTLVTALEVRHVCETKFRNTSRA